MGTKGQKNIYNKVGRRTLTSNYKINNNKNQKKKIGT